MKRQIGFDLCPALKTLIVDNNYHWILIFGILSDKWQYLQNKINFEWNWKKRFLRKKFKQYISDMQPKKCLDVNQRRRYKDAKLYQSYIKQSFPWSTSSSSTVSFSGSCTVSSWASCTVSSRASCTVSSWGSWRVSSWMSWEGSGLPLVTAEASPGWIK